MIVPDLIEPIVGWRAWVAEPTYDRGGRVRLALNSLYFPLHWTPGQPAAAVCEYGGHGPCADLDHLCGVHAARSLALVERYLPKHVRRPRQEWASKPTQVVVGSVALWGDVVEHEDGWRGERGYPVEIHVPSIYRARGTDVYASDAREMLAAAYPEARVRVFRHLADLLEQPVAV